MLIHVRLLGKRRDSDLIVLKGAGALCVDEMYQVDVTTGTYPARNPTSLAPAAVGLRANEGSARQLAPRRANPTYVCHPLARRFAWRFGCPKTSARRVPGDPLRREAGAN